MNKLILFPLIFMFLLMIFNWFGGGDTPSGLVPTYQGNMTFVNETANTTFGYTNTTEQGFNLMDTLGVLTILFASIAIGAIITIHFVGSGLGDFSGNVVFQATLYIGLWAALTWGTTSYLFANGFTILIWVATTVMFCIGFGQQVAGSE